MQEWIALHLRNHIEEKTEDEEEEEEAEQMIGRTCTEQESTMNVSLRSSKQPSGWFVYVSYWLHLSDFKWLPRGPSKSRKIKYHSDWWFYPDGSLILSKRIPSWYASRWPSEETLIILPSLPLFRAVFFIVSNKRFVKRKWPGESIWN